MPGASIGLPILHLDEAILDVEFERRDEPQPQLAERQTVTHRQRPGADKTFPTVLEPQTFDWAADRIGAIQHPHGLLVFRRRLEDIAQRRDERIDAAAQIL